MFRRPHHQRIAKLLQAFDSDLLLKAECFFGGGTAIALALGEYRESVDIDFLCSSIDGYRMLRSLVSNDLGPLLRYPVPHAREVISNQNKIFTFLEQDGTRIKVELVREGNTSLQGQFDPGLGVPVLSRTDLWAQKLMANADRALDKGSMNRDIIDIAMMLKHWGPLPREAFDKAYRAYGDALARGFHNAFGMLADEKHLTKCMHTMDIDLGLVDEILTILDDTAAHLPLNTQEQDERERRIAALPQLSGKAGAPFIFWRVASEAQRLATAQDPLNWARVEREAVIEGISQHGRDPHEMIDTIAEFSPAATSAARVKAISTRIEQQAPALQALYAADRQQHASPSP